MNRGVEMSLILVLSYGFGSIPIALLLSRLVGSIDPRTVGSGNIGATNMLRTGRRDLAYITLLLDISKGALAVGIAFAWIPTLSPWAALAAVIGHVFPIWLNFRGGKGVATGLGSLLVLAWPIFLLTCSLWLLMAAWKRISSLASLVSFSGATLAAIFFAQPFDAIAMGAITLIVLFAHRKNIHRLLTGTEPHINFPFLKRNRL